MGIIDRKWMERYTSLIKGSFQSIMADIQSMKDDIESIDNEVTVKDSRLTVTSDNRRFFVPMTELVTPARPTLTTESATIVSGSAVFNLSKPSGSTSYYKYARKTNEGYEDFGEWGSGNSVSIPSNYTNDKDNSVLIFGVKLKSNLYGEESEDQDRIDDVSIYPKVASGNIAITRNEGDDYSTSATIVLTPSATKDAVSQYKEGSSAWTDFTTQKTFTTTVSRAAGHYQLKATKSGYADASVAQSSAITLNKKRFYYGVGDSTLANETAIKALAGGGNKKQQTMAGTYDISVAITGKYVWFCGAGTLSSVTSSGFAVPMQSVVTVDGYNCYRSVSPVAETGTYTFKVE